MQFVCRCIFLWETHLNGYMTEWYPHYYVTYPLGHNFFVDQKYCIIELGFAYVAHMQVIVGGPIPLD